MLLAWLWAAPSEDGTFPRVLHCNRWTHLTNVHQNSCMAWTAKLNTILKELMEETYRTNLSTEIITLTFKPPSTWVAVSKSNLFELTSKKYAFHSQCCNIEFACSGTTCHGHCSAFLSPRTSVLWLHQFCNVNQLQGTTAFPGEDLVLPHASRHVLLKHADLPRPTTYPKKGVQCLPKYEHGC